MRVGRPESKWDYRAITVAQSIATWSSCTRDQVGAVVMSQDHDVISTGYNGTPAGWINCDRGGCPRAQRDNPPGSPQLDDELCLHAEANALMRAGLQARNAVLVVTRQPCAPCTRTAMTAGIERIVVTT